MLDTTRSNVEVSLDRPSKVHVAGDSNEPLRRRSTQRYTTPPGGYVVAC